MKFSNDTAGRLLALAELLEIFYSHKGVVKVRTVPILFSMMLGASLPGCADDNSPTDKLESYVGIYGSDFHKIRPYQHVDSKHHEEIFDVPNFVVKIVKEDDTYRLYYWLAEPSEFRVLEKSDTVLLLNGGMVQLSDDNNTLRIEASNTTAIRISDDVWRTIEPHAIMKSCSEHMEMIARDRGLTTYGEIGGFVNEYFENHITKVCDDNGQFYHDDIEVKE